MHSTLAQRWGVQEGMAHFDPGTIILSGLAMVRFWEPITDILVREKGVWIWGVQTGTTEVSGRLRSVSKLGDRLEACTFRERSLRT